jgi:hypothetical protein
MKILAACAVVPLLLAEIDALAQADPMDRLRACAVLHPSERVECLEKLSSDLGPPSAASAAAPAEKTLPPQIPPQIPPRTPPVEIRRVESAPAAEPPPAAEDWIVSQTTSPFDYSPIAVATALAKSSPDGAPLQLSIQCRGGGTELVLAGASIKRGEGSAVAYRIDDGGPVPLAAGAPASGTGVAVKGDVVRLLASLPDRGSVSFRITAPQGATLEGRYALAALNAVLRRLAGPCKWPAASQSGK